MTNPNTPVAGEPVEPSEERVDATRRTFWKAYDACEAVDHGESFAAGLRAVAAMPDERLTRERKRGERPELVERVAIAGWNASRVSSDDFADLGHTAQESWRRLARAVIAEIAEHSGDSDELAALRAELTGEQDDNVALRARIARLSGLAERMATEKARADRAEASCAAWRAATKCGNPEVAEMLLAQARARIAELEEEVAKERGRAIRRGEQADDAAEQLCQFRAAQEGMNSHLAELQDNLASMAKELRLLMAVETKARGTWSPERALLKAIDAHRAKPSPQSPISEDEYMRMALTPSPEESPPYETAPTLEKGVRYRVVEARPKLEHSIGNSHWIGAVRTADGTERVSGDWCDWDTEFTYRVVRVESAPAEKPERKLSELIVATMPKPILTSPFREVAERSAEPWQPLRNQGFATAAELAELARKVERLEAIASAHSPVTMRVLCEEIRAEREAKEKP